MSSIMQAVGQLIEHVMTVVPRWLHLFVYTNEYSMEGNIVTQTVVTPLGLFCIVLPLVGLGIGIIRRLVKIRA